MEPRFWIIVFGSLALVVGTFVGGFFAHGIWSPILITVGAFGIVSWLCVGIWFLNAMNSDI